MNDNDREAKLAALASLEEQFEAAGGRGVELAERIDALRVELGIADEWTCDTFLVAGSDDQRCIACGYEDGHDPDYFCMEDDPAQFSGGEYAIRRGVEACEAEECVWKGYHMTDCDEDGYCNNCGHQESGVGF